MAGAADDPLSPFAPTAEVVSGTWAGNDAVTTPDTNTDKDYEPTLRYWVLRRRAALYVLGIKVVHGIVG
jgi:hypothetical protein